MNTNLDRKRITYGTVNINSANNKIKLNGKRLIPSDHIKYLGVYLDETLSGFAHYDILSKKLHIANSYKQID